jgi:hypothetical protein
MILLQAKTRKLLRLCPPLWASRASPRVRTLGLRIGGSHCRLGEGPSRRGQTQRHHLQHGSPLGGAMFHFVAAFILLAGVAPETGKKR